MALEEVILLAVDVDVTDPTRVSWIRDRQVTPYHVKRFSAQGAGGGSHDRRMSPEQRLAYWLLAHADQRGSDVRLTSGELVQPSRITRQGANARWWKWNKGFGWGWKTKGAHINELEARAAMTELKRRSRSARSVGMMYLHLVDSQVCLGVLTKKRSSSHKLARVIRKMNSLELASHMMPVYAYVRSQHNPADGPSRKRRRGEE